MLSLHLSSIKLLEILILLKRKTTSIKQKPITLLIDVSNAQRIVECDEQGNKITYLFQCSLSVQLRSKNF